LVQRDRALAPQIRLQVRHQQCRRDPFSHDVADHHPQPLRTQIEKVVVIAANLPRLDAHARIVERFDHRPLLRKQSRLHFLGDF